MQTLAFVSLVRILSAWGRKIPWPIAPAARDGCKRTGCSKKQSLRMREGDDNFQVVADLAMKALMK